MAASLAALPVASPLAAERPWLPHLAADRFAASRGVSVAVRKESEREPDGALEGPVPTLATLVNLHTGEELPLSETEPQPAEFSSLVDDRGLNRRIDMAPELVALLRRVARPHPGVRIEIVSGYRSEKRNEMMRKKGHHVASHSQHTQGHAIDFRVEGLGVVDVVRALDRMDWWGGVGRYEGKADRFVHADVGPKRRWRGE